MGTGPTSAPSTMISRAAHGDVRLAHLPVTPSVDRLCTVRIACPVTLSCHARSSVWPCGIRGAWGRPPRHGLTSEAPADTRLCAQCDTRYVLILTYYSDTIMSEWERPTSAMKAKSLKSVIVSQAPLAVKPRRRRSLRSGWGECRRLA